MEVIPRTVAVATVKALILKLPGKKSFQESGFCEKTSNGGKSRYIWKTENRKGHNLPLLRCWKCREKIPSSKVTNLDQRFSKIYFWLQQNSTKKEQGCVSSWIYWKTHGNCNTFHLFKWNFSPYSDDLWGKSIKKYFGQLLFLLSFWYWLIRQMPWKY